MNPFIQVEHSKMEGISALRGLMEKDGYICKIDLKDAYVVVPMHIDFQKFLIFENEGVIYRHKSLAFIVIIKKENKACLREHVSYLQSSFRQHWYFGITKVNFGNYKYEN